MTQVRDSGQYPTNAIKKQEGSEGWLLRKKSCGPLNYTWSLGQDSIVRLELQIARPQSDNGGK